MSTTPMFSPDGTIGDIPTAKVPDAIKAGFKQGVDLMSPDGRPGTVPAERLQDALGAGFIMKGPAAVNNPNNLSQMIQQDEGQARTAGLPGGSPNIQPANDTMRNLALAGIGTGASVVGGPAALAMGKKALPYIKGGAKAGAGYAAAEAVVQGAKKLPLVGDYVSKIPGIDYLPFLVGMGSGEKKPEAAPESTEPLGPPKPDPALLESQGLAALPKTDAQPMAQSGEALASIPNRSSLPPALQPPMTKAAANRSLTNTLPEALGNKPVVMKPGVPIRNQFSSPGATEVKSNIRSAQGLQAGGTSELPEPQPRTPPPPRESTAVSNFKYDSDAKEMHITPKGGNGTTYVYGEATPDQAEMFKQAESKGMAWKAIRDNNPLVGKIMPDGKRVSMKPVMRTSDPTQDNDLVKILKQSLDAIQKK